ncbi:response regulator [Roseateles saccharophilus]|uniref:Excisionase family DNA binding protein n=1 Tax=Roseateles saccharophilus TaxID=304 RepID=A0A4R3U672_ROSSA|nr:response regulator [Roseateles saccharophilus]MDG0836156.1 response regulator [Roseateles saccharophilus]TCU81878.1 excisionase family DNA binding protein [Roseateles saccharophilus]
MPIDDSLTATSVVLTSREAGQRCGVSFRTVIRWIERGELSAYRLPGRGDYRIMLADLRAFASRYGLPDPAAAGPVPAPSDRVLIVDDDPSMARAIQRVLLAAGYKTLIANEGFQAGSLLHSFSPALMTLDLRMPGLDGFGVLRFLRDSPPRPALRVLVVSGESESSLREALELGADDALAKPFTNQQLLVAVQRLLPLPGTR